jgi:hypothetical protein
MRTPLALVVLVAAYVLLIPGITLTVITIDGLLDKSDVVDLGKQLLAEDEDVAPGMASMVNRFIENLDLEGNIEVYHQSRTVLGTVQNLFDVGEWEVAFLIMLFSVIIPALKGLMLLGVLLLKHRGVRSRLLRISGAISKWSMADVFVVALFVTYLAAEATEQQDELLAFDARFGTGFYCFLGYCLLSILSAQLIKLPPSAETRG